MSVEDNTSTTTNEKTTTNQWSNLTPVKASKDTTTTTTTTAPTTSTTTKSPAQLLSAIASTNVQQQKQQSSGPPGFERNTAATTTTSSAPSSQKNESFSTQLRSADDIELEMMGKPVQQQQQVPPQQTQQTCTPTELSSVLQSTATELPTQTTTKCQDQHQHKHVLHVWSTEEHPQIRTVDLKHLIRCTCTIHINSTTDTWDIHNIIMRKPTILDLRLVTINHQLVSTVNIPRCLP